MAWFALHPPEGVRVVSFFATNRIGFETDWRHAADALVTQLAELAARPMPQGRFDIRARLRELLAAAAVNCLACDERLVLVLDALDEDSGAPSIAGLLPVPLPDGVRVVVSSRTDAPLPSDLAVEHPLRDPAIVRYLSCSPRATEYRITAEQRLARLLRQSFMTRKLTGMLVVSGGGLTADDLQRLSWIPRDRNAQYLTTVAASCGVDPYTEQRLPDGRQPYVLAHAELHNSAAQYLGPGALAKYRRHLHRWADRYRADNWPEGTPEYLLRNYFRMLAATEDTARMLRLATDTDRHTRMADSYAGETNALVEIAAAQDLLRADTTPDLNLALSLAMTRERLIGRNHGLCPDLPVAWLRLGHGTRAETLAWTLRTPSVQMSAVADLVRELVEAGQPMVARLLTQRAEIRCRTRPVSDTERDSIESDMARCLATVGATDRAIDWALSAANLNRRTARLSYIALETRSNNDWAAARRVCDLITDPYVRADSLQSTAYFAALTDASEVAWLVIRHVELVAERIGDPYLRASVLADLAETCVEAGDNEGAQSISDRIDELVPEITAAPLRAHLLGHRIRDAYRIYNDGGQAPAAASAIADPWLRTHELCGLAINLAIAQDRAAALRIAESAEFSARSVPDSVRHADALGQVVYVLGFCDEIDRALVVADAIADPKCRDEALASLAYSSAFFDEPGRALAVIDRIGDLYTRLQPLSMMVEHFSDRGDLANARRIRETTLGTALSITDPRWRTQGLLELAEEVKDPAFGRRCVDSAVAACHATHYENQQPWLALLRGLTVLDRIDLVESTVDSAFPPDLGSLVLLVLAKVVAAEGDLAQARRLAAAAVRTAMTESSPLSRGPGLADIATAVAAFGDINWARRILDDAQALNEAIADRSTRDLALSSLARVAVEFGDFARAESLVDAIVEPTERVLLWRTIADTLVTTGDLEPAYRILCRAEAILDSVTNPNDRSFVLRELAEIGMDTPRDRAQASEQRNPLESARGPAEAVRAALAAADFDRAEAILRTVTDADVLAAVLRSVVASATPAQIPELLVAASTFAGCWALMPAFADFASSLVLTKVRAEWPSTA
ncbi:hypothetical protein [Nocardia sp. NPDC049149]|uniref:hypothetical protein n=1 Tax=Nocardia sp. NPDC049149 TaxID=3364315 RepID=UPI00371BD2B7